MGRQRRSGAAGIAAVVPVVIAVTIATTARHAGADAPVASGGAAPAPEPIRVELHAPADCAGGDAFLAQVLARTPLARPAAAGEPARTFAVSIRNTEARWMGVLVVIAVSGERSSRTVAASTCPDVVAALALVAALTVDPAASTAPLAALPVAPVPATPPSASPPPPVPPPRAPATAAPAPHPAPRPAPPAAPPRQPLPPEPTAWSASVAGLVGALGAVAPDPMPVLRLMGTLELADAGVLAPALRISAAAGRSTASAAPASVAFTWISGRVDACPIAWRPIPVLTLRPCAALDVGALRAAPAPSGALAQARSGTEPWISADAIASAEWRAGRLVVLLEGGAVAPIVRDTWVFQGSGGGSDTVVHATPRLGAMAAVGAGVTF